MRGEGGGGQSSAAGRGKGCAARKLRARGVSYAFSFLYELFDKTLRCIRQHKHNTTLKSKLNYSIFIQENVLVKTSKPFFLNYQKLEIFNILTVLHNAIIHLIIVTTN